MENIIKLFKRLNLTETETKAYIMLLQNGASTGYEVSKISGVPQSKVYNVLGTMVEKGLAYCSKHTKPVYYSAAPLDEVLGNAKHQFTEVLEELEVNLKDIDKKVDMDYIWYIRGYENIFNKCRNLLSQTKKELYLQIWREDLDQVYDTLLALEKQNVKTIVILYNSDDETIALKNYFRHGFEAEKLKEIGARWLTMVSDSRDVLFGPVGTTGRAEVVWTQSLPLVFMAKEYVRHDAYCRRLLEIAGDKLGPEDDRLKQIRRLF